MKGIEYDADIWKDILGLQIKRIMFLIYPYYPKLSIDLMKSLLRFL